MEISEKLVHHFIVQMYGLFIHTFYSYIHTIHSEGLFLLKLYFGAGKVAQVVECLPRNFEVLSSNLSADKKKKLYLTYFNR
jgi:hypothetical protein